MGWGSCTHSIPKGGVIPLGEEEDGAAQDSGHHLKQKQGFHLLLHANGVWGLPRGIATMAGAAEAGADLRAAPHPHPHPLVAPAP